MKIPKINIPPLNYLILITAAVILVFSVAVLTFFKPETFNTFSLVLSNVFEKTNLASKSSASLEYTVDRVKINFDITERDFKKVEVISAKLGIGDDWTKGVQLQLNSEMIGYLKDNLPQEFVLNFNEDGLVFTSKGAPVLKSALADKKYEFSTGSSKLTLNSLSPKDYDLEIIEPEKVLKYASSSGKLYVSQRLDGVLPILSKIAKIEIRSRNGEVRGEIKLK